MARPKPNEVEPPKESAPPATQADAELRRTILDYLAARNSMTIASCNENVPWAAAVFYVNDELDLYFLSSPASRHGWNMAANSRVSAAIHEDYHDWREIRGIQLEGRAERVRSPKLQLRFWELYNKKFPFVEAFFTPGGLQELVLSKVKGVRLYRIVPQAVYYLDNSRGFGHRELLSLAPTEPQP